MNKVAAEIIAGLIPHKQTRNRWRGILRFGLINALRLKHQIRSNNERPAHYLAVCVIAKNEGPYFKEWLDWHISQGVEKFYVYDNESTDETTEVLKPYIEKGIVDYTFFPGYRRQLAAYDDCFRRHRFHTRWLAFIDMDEFILPLKDSSIPEYLRDLEEFPVVEVNWLCYGSSGQKKKMPGGVMQRFRRHSLPDHPLNRHVKSIVDPRRVYCMTGCHEAARINGKAADSHGQRVRISWKDRSPQHDIIRINHYAVKSLEEFQEKKGRGRASGKARTVEEEYFNRFDLNDLPDSSTPNP
ncbi:MAG: glycosyltransferase family 92 protein [Muribaculaceae bacterium]|nr:glycosyltransferase family 92 protein [Muribaculaceae bacterium]